MAPVPFSTQALAAVLLSKRHVEEQYGFRVPVHAWIDGFTRRRCGLTRNGAPGYVEGEEIVWAVVSAKLGTAAILFHVTSAYVILRHNGVKIGKKKTTWARGELRSIVCALPYDSGRCAYPLPDIHTASELDIPG